ncbi:NAD(P)-binding protein [Corynespora cassiicola Philippines]|uniref:NAD(P)-binding protein n=1 Tax=Corynespora cassiicola Philippines TaxID=1448308 RepID=A0A2T2NV82_CORCC|nr:NAD(P)-binding protein [Corynespora cassiicola Philippines]
MASTVLKPLGFALNQPLFTGALLYLLTKGPPELRDRLLEPLRNNLANNGAATIARLIKVLKFLTAIGIVRRIHRALNSLAYNNWKLGRAGAPFKFGPQKEEMVVITGGSSGFGYEMVKAFSKVARVVVLDVAAFPPELGSLPDVHFYQCDVTNTPLVEGICSDIKRTHGEATVLINNAGIANGKTVLETTNEQTERLMKVNLLCHFVLIREFLPGMLKRNKGHIVSVASMASFVAAPGLVDYCVSKVGALYLNDGIRAECMSRYPGGEGICTTSVHPSWHATGIIKGSEKLLEKYGVKPDPPNKVSDAILEQVLKGKSGRLIVPTTEARKAMLRSWPLWLQDILIGNASSKKKKKRTFEFGREENSAL